MAGGRRVVYPGPPVSSDPSRFDELIQQRFDAQRARVGRWTYRLRVQMVLVWWLVAFLFDWTVPLTAVACHLLLAVGLWLGSGFLPVLLRRPELALLLVDLPLFFFIQYLGLDSTPDSAFAVGEDFTPDESADLGFTALARNLTAKVAAHEVGHLMGGHHHYANCAEGLLSEVGSELSPCTLMFNAVDASSLNFSSLNGLVVRGHGEAYAAP